MSLAQQLNDALPQTQCTRCGYPDCQRYAQAMALGEAGINQCPPGGQEGVVRLAALTGQPVTPLNPDNGLEGPRTIALIDEEMPVVVIATYSEHYEKVVSNIQEVKARGAKVIAIADSSTTLDVPHLIRIPSSHELLQPILSIVPLQVFAYEMAVARGNDVDQPRNLAKSVTVE